MSQFCHPLRTTWRASPSLTPTTAERRLRGRVSGAHATGCEAKAALHCCCCRLWFQVTLDAPVHLVSQHAPSARPSLRRGRGARWVECWPNLQRQFHISRVPKPACGRDSLHCKGVSSGEFRQLPWIVYLSRTTSGLNTSHREAGKISGNRHVHIISASWLPTGHPSGSQRVTHVSTCCTSCARRSFPRATRPSRRWRRRPCARRRVRQS